MELANLMPNFKFPGDLFVGRQVICHNRSDVVLLLQGFQPDCDSAFLFLNFNTTLLTISSDCNIFFIDLEDK